MKDNNVSLTLIDKMILESYKTVMEGLAAYMGEGYEMVLHSLGNLNESVINIINGQYTGRKEGAPITDLALSMLSEIKGNGINDYKSYFTNNKNGELLKSSTIAIRGEGNKVIGLLCINFHMNTPLSDIIANFRSNEDINVVIKNENFVENSDDLIKKYTLEAKNDIEGNNNIRPSLKKKEIVAVLYKQGVFEFKNSVTIIADILDLSRNTVYLHLRSLQINDK